MDYIYKQELKMGIQNCNFVKTILMLLVILGHSVHFWTGDWFIDDPINQSAGLEYLSDWLNSFHTYAFVLVSGYIFAYKMNRGEYSQYIPFLINKAKRLIVPYIFTAVIWVVPISQYFFQWDLMVLIKKYLFCVSPSQLWFLWMLFGVFAIIWPLWKWFSKNVIGGVLSLVFYVIGIVGPHFIPNVFCIWLVCQYIPFFYIGVQIQNRQMERGKIHIMIIPVWCWIIADGMLFVINDIVEKGQISVSGIGGITAFALHVVGSLMAIVILQKIACIVPRWGGVFVKSFSRYSMPMYLFHQQIIYFTIVWLNGKVEPYINAGINFIVTVAVTFIISWILMKFKVTRLLIGEK